MASRSELEVALRRRPVGWEPWLVFGDELSERGDVRGELISLGHHLGRARSHAERARLQAQIEALTAKHERKWRGPLPRVPAIRAEWQHGFIVGLEVKWSETRHGELAAFLADPASRLLSTLCLTGVGQDLEDDDFDEDDDGFDDLDEDGQLRIDPTEAVAALRELLTLDLRRIGTLSLAYLQSCAPGAKAIAALDAKRVPELRRLDLRYNEIGDAGARALAAAPFLSQLRALHLQNNQIGPTGVQRLLQLEWPALEVLDLHRNPIGPKGAKAIAAKNFPKLTRLRLDRADVGAGTKALAQSSELPPHLHTHWKALHAAQPVVVD